MRAAPVFAATLTVTVPEPAPLAGLTVTQVVVPRAAQAQVELLEDTVTVPVPPAGVIESDVAESPYVHDSAS